MIIVDTNSAEDFFFQYCTDSNIPVTRQRLDVGDIVLSFEDKDYVLERKTWADLSASICDGRWSEQKSRMGAELTKPTQYAYIVEGELVDWNKDSKMHLPMWGALVKTQMRDGMHVFHTKHKQASVDLVIYLHTQMEQNGFEVKHERLATSGAKRKRDNLSSPQSIYTAMLTVIPGMSQKKADTIVSAYSRPTMLCQASVNDIANLICNERKIGPVIAKRIHDVFNC
jgi:ERCC4-type nuclease